MREAFVCWLLSLLWVRVSSLLRCTLEDLRGCQVSTG